MLLTFGHGTAAAGQITELLWGAHVAELIDIRIAPGSRRHPHVARAELERWLPEAGISYRWERQLGGFRKAGHDSPDTAWREDMFRGYAAHMRTAAFLAGPVIDADRMSPVQMIRRIAAQGRAAGDAFRCGLEGCHGVGALEERPGQAPGRRSR